MSQEAGDQEVKKQLLLCDYMRNDLRINEQVPSYINMTDVQQLTPGQPCTATTCSVQKYDF